ncbi:MAG: hypothetical protein ACK4RM_07980 [Flavobacterium sp.]
MFYFKHITYVVLLCIGLSSCATSRLCKKYDAVNEKKLTRAYVVENGDERLEFENEQAWLDYCDSQNPWGYSVLKQSTELFTGTSLRVYKKRKLSKPYAYAIFTYRNGFIDGIYSFHLINGDTLINGLCTVDKTVSWGDGLHKPSSPLLNGGLDMRELDRHRKEFVIREQIFNSSGRLISFYVRDSIYLNISEIHDATIKEWEEIEYKEYGKFRYNLRTAQNGDTLYYLYESDSLKILIDSDYNFHPYYGNVHVSNDFYSYPAKSFYKLDRNIPSWDTINKVISIQTKDIELKMTFQRDTIELVRKVNDIYHGLLLRFSSSGDTIEKIPFINGKLNGTWVKFDTNGDTLFYRNFLNGKEHGKSAGRNRMNGTYVIENFVNGLLDGKVLIYKYEIDLSLTPTEKKYVKYEFSMKEGLKHDVCIEYYDHKPIGNHDYMDEDLIYESTEYFKDMKHGLYKNYNEDGTLKEEGMYQYDKRDGIWKYYDLKDGNLEVGYEYKNDKILKKIYYNPDGTIQRTEDY